jgi:hypothetical protein
MDYFENIHSNKMENQGDKFLDNYDNPKLNQDNINHINRSQNQKRTQKRKRIAGQSL